MQDPKAQGSFSHFLATGSAGGLNKSARNWTGATHAALEIGERDRQRSEKQTNHSANEMPKNRPKPQNFAGYPTSNIINFAQKDT